MDFVIVGRSTITGEAGAKRSMGPFTSFAGLLVLYCIDTTTIMPITIISMTAAITGNM